MSLLRITFIGYFLLASFGFAAEDLTTKDLTTKENNSEIRSATKEVAPPAQNPTPAPTTSPTAYSPAQISFEVLGNAFLYSFFGSYRFGPFLGGAPNLAFNLGFSTLSITEEEYNKGSTTTSLFQFPFSLSFLWGNRSCFFEALAGIDYVSAKSKSKSDLISDSGLVKQVGVGFRYWPDNGGFHFRGMIIRHMFSNGMTLTWPGIAFGYAF